MNKIKLGAFLFALVMVFSLPVAFVKAEDDSLSKDRESSVNRDSGSREGIEDQSKDSDTEDNLKKEDSNDDNDEQDKVENKSNDDDENYNGEEYLNKINNITKNLLKVSDHKKTEISEPIKAIVQDQDDNKDEVAKKIKKIKDRSKFKNFLIGSDYGTVGELRSDIVKTSNQIDQLKKVLDKTTDLESKKILQEQVTNLEQEQTKINNFLNASEDKFSLLGWLIKMFY